MQLNVLNDLAKAKRRWTENNTIVWVKQHSTMRKPGIVPARSHRASHQGITTHKPKHFDASNTPERNLSGLWAPVCFCRFTLDPVWHHVSLCPISTFHLPHGSVIAGFWIVSKYLWECCPCGLHSVISRLLAGGSLGFRIVPLLLPGSQITVWHFCGVVCLLLFSFAIPIP